MILILEGKKINIKLIFSVYSSLYTATQILYISHKRNKKLPYIFQ